MLKKTFELPVMTRKAAAYLPPRQVKGIPTCSMTTSSISTRYHHIIRQHPVLTQSKNNHLEIFDCLWSCHPLMRWTLNGSEEDASDQCLCSSFIFVWEYSTPYSQSGRTGQAFWAMRGDASNHVRRNRIGAKQPLTGLRRLPSRLPPVRSITLPTTPRSTMLASTSLMTA